MEQPGCTLPALCDLELSRSLELYLEELLPFLFEGAKQPAKLIKE